MFRDYEHAIEDDGVRGGESGDIFYIKLLKSLKLQNNRETKITVRRDPRTTQKVSKNYMQLRGHSFGTREVESGLFCCFFLSVPHWTDISITSCPVDTAGTEK